MLPSQRQAVDAIRIKTAINAKVAAKPEVVRGSSIAGSLTMSPMHVINSGFLPTVQGVVFVCVSRKGTFPGKLR